MSVSVCVCACRTEQIRIRAIQGTKVPRYHNTNNVIIAIIMHVCFLSLALVRFTVAPRSPFRSSDDGHRCVIFSRFSRQKKNTKKKRKTTRRRTDWGRITSPRDDACVAVPVARTVHAGPVHPARPPQSAMRVSFFFFIVLKVYIVSSRRRTIERRDRCVCVCVLGGGQAGRHNNINDRAQTKGETAIFFYKKTPTIGQKCTPSQLTKKSRKTRENPDEPGGKTRKENHVQSAKTNKNSRQTRFLAGFFFRYEQDA